MAVGLRRVSTSRLTLLACILGSAAVFLDGMLVNVALPAIREDLGGGLSTQQWVVDGYLLTLGSLLLVGGSLGDLFGRRAVFAVGVAGFGVASLGCAVAPTAATLIAARALQGAAGALLVPSTLALIIDTFPEDQRAGAIGTWTAWSGIATVAGPLLGGLLVELGSWRLIFVVNLPVVLVVLALLRVIPSRPGPPRPTIDWIGGLLGTISLGGPIFGLIQQPSAGWGSVQVWGGLLIGAAMMIAFVLWERRAREPMLPLSLFGVRNFRVGNAATLAFYGALNITTFVLVVFLQQVAGYGPLAAGMSLLPISVIVFLLAKRFGSLADRFGPRLPMGIGPLVVCGGLLILAGTGAHPRYLTDILPGVAVFGLGLAITVAPLTAAVLAAVEDSRAGIASAVNNAVARVAGLVAIAAVGAVLAAAFSASVSDQLASTPASATGAGQPVATGTSPRSAASFAEALAAARSKPFVLDVSQFPAGTRDAARQALTTASVDGLRLSLELAAALAFAAGLGSLLGIRKPSRELTAAGCPGGALCGASAELGHGKSSPMPTQPSLVLRAGQAWAEPIAPQLDGSGEP